MEPATFSNTEPLPRVNAAQSSALVGRRVLLVGRALEGGDKLQCADDGIIVVKYCAANSHQPQQQGYEMFGPLAAGKVVEIAGVIEPQGVIREESRMYPEGNVGTYFCS